MVSKSKPNIDCYEGEWRRPINDLQDQLDGGGNKSIHDETTAQAAGFSNGAPIHGTVHWSQLTPLLLKVYGKEWFEKGTISTSFKTVVTHLQPVKAFIEKPNRPKEIPLQVKVWMEHMDGRLVFDGTASLGKDDDSTMIDRQLQKNKPLKGNLVFVPYKPNTKSSSIEQACITWDDKIIGKLFPFTTKEKLDVITEWHPWFSQEHFSSSEKSPWEKPILSPEALNQIMLYTWNDQVKWPDPPYNLLPPNETPVGMFGACEVKIHNGPVFLNKTYAISREIIATGETPRTEFRWTKTTMRDSGDSGQVIAEMTLQDMLLKNTVKGYDELRLIANRQSLSNSYSRL